MEYNVSDLQGLHSIFDHGGKTIRDNVHGDILVPDRFLRVVNTPEFQRLRRIKQLATAQYVFPSADHTRFAHSIGTFAVMQRIISHFEQYFQVLGAPDLIKEEDKDTLLLAALLHDLGHTPFSHAMEDVLPNAKKIPHEQWTVDIITDEGGTLNKVIKEEFGSDYPQKVADLILQNVGNGKTPSFNADEISLGSIFHSLISSQIDADRLDYIRRDALATGVSYGLIDIDRIISGFRVGILDNGKAVVCIAEKFLPDIEGYLYARYQMYRNVYLKPYKILTEGLLRKIVSCVYELYEHDKIKVPQLPPGFKAALQQPSMSVDDYLSLDDYTIMGAIKGWSKLNNEHTRVLRIMCQCLINRKGFVRYRFADTSKRSVAAFKREISNILSDGIGPSACEEMTDEEWIDKIPFLVMKTVSPRFYKASSENSIYIIENSGRLLELSDCSGLIRTYAQSTDDENAQPEVSAIYFSESILKVYLDQMNVSSDKIEAIVKKVKELLDRNHIKNTIEIEKKYYVPDDACANDAHIVRLKNELEKMGFDVRDAGQDNQQDRYLDTVDNRLLNSHCTLRIRISPKGASLTCKMPVAKASPAVRRGRWNDMSLLRI